jgi:hypothetical protein
MKMKKTKNSITSAMSNIVYTNTINPNITTTTTGTNINTTISPNYSNLTFQLIRMSSTPFNIKLSWGGKEVNISLKNGNDIFKLANVFMKMLDSEGIEYNIETNKKRR